MKRAVPLAAAFFWLVAVPAGGSPCKIKPAKVPADGVARIVLQVEGEESVPVGQAGVQIPQG